MAAETSLGGLPVGSGKVGFNEGGDSIVPQLVSHPPQKREDRQEQGWRAFGWSWAVGRGALASLAQVEI